MKRIIIRILFTLLAVILGAMVTTDIDHWLGISFNEVSAQLAVAHKVMYMLWGGVLVAIWKDI